MKLLSVLSPYPPSPPSWPPSSSCRQSIIIPCCACASCPQIFSRKCSQAMYGDGRKLLLSTQSMLTELESGDNTSFQLQVCEARHSCESGMCDGEGLPRSLQGDPHLSSRVAAPQDTHHHPTYPPPSHNDPVAWSVCCVRWFAVSQCHSVAVSQRRSVAAS